MIRWQWRSVTFKSQRNDWTRKKEEEFQTIMTWSVVNWQKEVMRHKNAKEFSNIYWQIHWISSLNVQMELFSIDASISLFSFSRSWILIPPSLTLLILYPSSSLTVLQLAFSVYHLPFILFLFRVTIFLKAILRSQFATIGSVVITRYV